MGDTNDDRVVEVTRHQLQHFTRSDPPCHAMQLPDGVLLRHTRSSSLYFYLRTAITDGKLLTRIFASDSPYDRERAEIGMIRTPMFETDADRVHLGKIEETLRTWVGFVGDEMEHGPDFTSFPVQRGAG